MESLCVEAAAVVAYDGALLCVTHSGYELVKPPRI
jgi:hypothetical protein